MRRNLGEYRSEVNELLNKVLPEDMKQAFEQARKEVNTKRRRAQRTPEAKSKRKEYVQRPEVRAKIKKYNQRPDVRLKNLEYNKMYRQQPNFKLTKRKRKEKLRLDRIKFAQSIKTNTKFSKMSAYQKFLEKKQNIKTEVKE